jgi:hypothetical protein
MEQTVSVTWAELLAGAAGFAIMIVGSVWAVIGAAMNNFERENRMTLTQMERVYGGINGLGASLADLKVVIAHIARELNATRDDLDKLRAEVDTVNANVARITTFLGHLAGTPPSFPRGLLSE